MRRCGSVAACARQQRLTCAQPTDDVLPQVRSSSRLTLAPACSLTARSLNNVGARGVTEPNFVVGLAFFYGGGAQAIAGIFEFIVGNTFGACMRAQMAP